MNTTIDQIVQMPDKAIVYGFEGTVSKAYKRSDGNNSHGAWSIESFMVKDASGAEIKLMVKDMDPLGWREGQKFRLEAHKGEKGFSGLYAEDDEYKGQVRRILKATGSCHVHGPGGGQQQQPAPQQNHQPSQQQPAQGNQQPRQQTTQQQAPQGQQPQQGNTGTTQGKRHTPDEVEEFKDAKRTIIQIANLHLLCTLVVDKYEAPRFEKLTGTPMSDAQRQATASSIFIKADKLGLDRKMPARDIADLLEG